MLLNYSRFYQQIYDMMPHERPDDKLLENDEELDKWWSDQIADRSRKLAKHFKGSSGGNQGASAAVPVFTPG